MCRLWHCKCAGDDACEVTKALKALAVLCCQHRTMDSLMPVVRENINLTPLTLALVVVSAASRVSGIIGM